MFKEQQKLKENILSIFDKYEDFEEKYKVSIENKVYYMINIQTEKGHFKELEFTRKREDIPKINEDIKQNNLANPYFTSILKKTISESFMAYRIEYSAKEIEKKYIEEYQELEKLLQEQVEKEQMKICFSINIENKNGINIFHYYENLNRENYDFFIKKVKEIYSNKEVKVKEEGCIREILIKL